MNPSKPFILRPVATSLLMAAVLLVGIVAYRQLSVSALPEVDYPTIQVLTFYPGASPDVVATSITAPLERQFGQVPGLNQMTSTSSQGASVITLQFVLDLNIDIAEQGVQAAINSSGTYLPPDLPNPPVYSKTNPADTPIITLALTSKTMPLPKVEDFADTRLAQKLSQLPGVGLVSISGGQKPAVRIQANPTVLSSYGISLEDVRSTIAASNVNQAKGNFDGKQQAYTIAANDQLLSSDDYRPLIIAYRNGAPIHLSDVAKIIDDTENIKQAAWMNETPAVILNIQRQPGANIIEVVDRVKKLLPTLKSSLPAAIDLAILTDRTTTIRASVSDVQFELMLTIGLVVMVIFLFLRNLAATIIPSVAVPLSLVGTFGVMYLLGYSLNNLTLMALTISTGFVVDDAIVMIENIVRYIEEGDSPMEAALKGSEQIGFTILSLTVSLIAVLIPLLFMGDIVGRLFREFAITLSVTILVSAVVSLTLTPMMCARLLRHTPDSEQSRFYKVSERIFERIIEFYATTLRFVLKHQFATLLVAIATLAATFLLFLIIPKGFFPVQDTGVILGISEAPQTISFSAMGERQQTLAKVILQDPAVESLSSFIGVDGTNSTLNSGRIQINLKPLDDRKISASDVIRRLSPEIDKISGITLFMQAVQDLSVEDRVSRTQYQYSLEDPDAKELAEWTSRFVEKLQELPQLRDVASDQQNLGLQAKLLIDRNTASRFGITPQMIDDTLYDAYGQRQVSIMFTQLNQYRVVLEVDPSMKLRPTDLKYIYVKSPLAGGQAQTPGSGGASSGGSSSSSSSASASASGASAFASNATGAAQNSTLVNASASSGSSPNSARPIPASQLASAGSANLAPIASAAGNNGSSQVSIGRGNQVPLSAFARFEEATTPLTVNHQGQFPAATVSFNLAPKTALGDAVSAIDKVKKDIGMPGSVQSSFQGTAAAFQNSLSNESLLILAALVTVYIVLGVLYESYIHPITILSTLPSAGVGALLALLLCGEDFSVIALIGIILLIGIVEKNAIMMIDFALEAERKGGKEPFEAIYQACLLRFRPILMTTMAALLGGVPLALGSGVGSELRRPLGIAIVGGLIFSQMLTLYTTPVIYLAFDRLARRFGKSASGLELQPTPQPERA